MFQEIAVHATEGCSLDRVRDCVERTTGERLKEAEDDYNGRYFETECNSQFFTTVEDFSANRFFDDAGIPFSRLPILVNFEPYSYGAPHPRSSGNEGRQELCREIAMRVAGLIFEELGCDCIVVEDMQRVVGTFRSPANHWLVQRSGEEKTDSSSG